MKELFKLFFHGQWRALFIAPADNGWISFFRYCFVGGIAFVADYGTFTAVCLLAGSGAPVTVIATTAGFFVGLAVNFLLSKMFVFTEKANCRTRGGEFIWYAAIGAGGYLLNVLLMMLATEWLLSMNRYIAKAIAAVIVLVYNYAARKAILYSSARGKDGK